MTLRGFSIAALGLIVLASCGHQAQQRRGSAALDVEVAAAKRQTIATFLSLDGQVAPLEESTLSFQQAGPLTAIYVNEGDRVVAGQLLAKIDDSTLRAQLAQDEALISQAAARAQSSAITVPITASQTSDAVRSAKAALDNAQLTYNQDLQLFKQGYVSQAQLEQARAAYVGAQTQYQTAIANQKTTEVSSSNAAADRAAVQSAQAQANTLQTAIGQTALYAPFDGVITARLMDPGAMASPSTPVLRIDRVDSVWINVNVPDEDLSYVHAGTPVTFTAGTLGSRFTGRIFAVNAVPTQGTLSYQARIRQPNPGDVLRGGMLVSVTVQQARHNNAIVVPRQAVAQSDQGTTVFIVGPGKKAVEVPVRVGLQTDTLSEVRSPRVRAGTLVITTRPDALQNGSVVAFGGPSAQGAAGAPGATPGKRHRRSPQ
ncbi:MAG TPA: efflux RND transporter periplasmic adaptor subunit [Candidatus Rubrimentiphilum sp.]|nr:efflux RND transporter periplasmic adaptor subunit [Candidatus Rubrimentiphilum sp.]